jgi:ABC-type transport system involved in cytochrome c biogenesis permease component
MTAATVRMPVSAAPADTLVIARRHLIRLERTPQLLVSTLAVPVMFTLMFRYIFGGAIPVPGMSYVDYLIPALLAQNAIFDGFGAAFAVDARDGVVDRFRALPMARSAVLTGRALADLLRQAVVLAVLTGVAVAVGFRFHAPAWQSIAGLAMGLLLGQVLFWVFAAIAQDHTERLRGDAATYIPWLLSGASSQTLNAILSKFPPPLLAAYRERWAPRCAALDIWNAADEPAA